MSINKKTNIIPYLYEGVYVVDKHRKIIFWNEGCKQITGYSAEEVTHSFCYQNILQHVDETGKQLCFEGCPLQKTLNDGVINESKIYLRHKAGHRVPVMVKTLPIYGDNNEIVAAIEIFTNELFQKQVYHENLELKDQLRTDALTKIANRHFFDFQIAKKLEEIQIFSNTFGILMIDIDLFKDVNDKYGHLVGDEILKIVAKSLSSNIEKTDMVSRWGGEEFVAIVNVTNEDDLLKIAERLRHIVAASSYQTEDGHIIQVTISIGGTLFKSSDTVKTLIARADDNMYYVKRHGRNHSKIL